MKAKIVEPLLGNSSVKAYPRRQNVTTPLLGDENMFLWKELVYENEWCLPWVRPDAYDHSSDYAAAVQYDT
jgi:hypothetical protein